MDKTIFTPEESLLLITKTIEETKQRFKEISSVFILWGFLLSITNLTQFILWQHKLYKIAGFLVFIYLIAAIYTAIYMWKKSKRNNWPTTIIGNILMTLGILIGVNLMIMALFFGPQLGNAFMPVFLILISFWPIISGTSIKFKPLIIGGILQNLIAFAAFLIDWQYHPLIMSLAHIIGILIPGIMLYIDQKKVNV